MLPFFSKWMEKRAKKEKTFAEKLAEKEALSKPKGITAPGLTKMRLDATKAYYQTQAPKYPKIKGEKYRRRSWALREGYAWNPLLKWPVNSPCWCGSKKKAKKCCKPFIPHSCTKELAATIHFLWEDLMLGRKTLPGVPRKKK
jgi:hypothetical protein